MGVSVTLLEITPEIWQEEWLQEWIVEGVIKGEIPTQVSDFREPKLLDIGSILEEFEDIKVELNRTANQLHIVFSKLSQFPSGIKYYKYHEDIYVTSTSSHDNLLPDSFVTVEIGRCSSERIDKFIQLLANRCGTYLLLHNGEPVQFFVPQTTE
jgi:hypothetical protein